METRRVSEVELDSVQSSFTRRVSNLVTASSGYHSCSRLGKFEKDNRFRGQSFECQRC